MQKYKYGRSLALIVCLFFISNSYADEGGVTIDSIKNDIGLFPDSIELSKYHPRIIPEYFLAGSLTYCKPWGVTLEMDSVVDYYYSNEKHVMNYMFGYLKKTFNLEMYVDSSKGWIYSKQILRRLSNIIDTNRTLKNVDQMTTEEICSFLLGACYKEGRKITDSTYRIMPYRTDKNSALSGLLRRAGCDKIYINYMRGSVPDLTVYYFEASPILRKYFETLTIEMQ